MGEEDCSSTGTLSPKSMEPQCVRALGTIASFASLGLAATATYLRGWLGNEKVVQFYDSSGAYLDVYSTMQFGIWCTIQRIEPEFGPKLVDEEGFWWPFNCFTALSPSARVTLNFYLLTIWVCWGLFLLLGFCLAFYFYACNSSTPRTCKVSTAIISILQSVLGVAAVYVWVAFKNHLEDVYTQKFVEVNYLHLQLDLGWYLAALSVILAWFDAAVLIYGAGRTTGSQKEMDVELAFSNINSAHEHTY